MSHAAKKRILVVCMGNICRSPTGEAVLRAKTKQLGVNAEVDSAGTIDYHQGKSPDSRAQQAAEKRGYSFKGMTSRPVNANDFSDFDVILAADKANLADLYDICPKQYQHKLSLFLSHGSSSYSEIPDPYYGGEQGFELVLDLIEESSEAVLSHLSSL